MRQIPLMISLIVLVITFIVVPTAYGAQPVNDRIKLDTTTIPATFDFDDELLGYYIESIGDLDGDGVVDLATIMFEDDSGETDAGSILILFMNSDGSVSSTNEITMDVTASGIGSSCIVGDSTNRDNRSLEQLAFVGDLDNDGMPTLALGANSNDHDTGSGVVVDAGAVYMLELNSNGTVDNCVLITEDNGGFAPADGVYVQDGVANFGWPVIATDLNGDGQNELIVGATSEDDNYTDLWPLFLTSTGAVSSHPAIPVSGNTIGMDSGNYIDDGDTVNNRNKIVVGSTITSGGSIFIINLTSDGAFSSSTEITGESLGQGIANTDEFGGGMTSLGDLDGDGVDDILVAAHSVSSIHSNSGAVYILFMNSNDSVKESQKISNESEFARTGVTPFVVTDLFGHGMALWKNSGGQAVIAISAHADDTGGTDLGAIHLFYIQSAFSGAIITTHSNGDSNGDSDGKHNSKPTFGLDFKTNVQRVDGGLVINNQTFQINDNFWTEIPMQNLTVGSTQNFTAKTYASEGLSIMEFLFGIPEVGKGHQAEAMVTFYFNFTGGLDRVEALNVDETLINPQTLNYTAGKAFCKPGDSTKLCDRVSMEVSFNEAPVGKVLALQAIDDNRRSNIVYFNDGITIQGDSQNPPVTLEIMSEVKYKGLQTIQRIDKENNIWVTLDEDEPVSKYQQNSFGTFFPIDWKKNIIVADKITTFIDRKHSEFYRLSDYEEKRALEYFDSQIIQAILGPSFIYDYPIEQDRIEKIQDIIEFEKKRALGVLDKTYIYHEKDTKTVKHLEVEYSIEN